MPDSQTADQQLRDQVAEALMAWAESNNTPGNAPFRRPETVTRNAYSRAGAVLAVLQPEMDRLRAENAELVAELGARDEKARKRWIKAQEKQLGIRFADFRAGRWEMDLAMGREMAAAYVAMAKTMLGDAPNYTETKLEFDVKIAEPPETYTLVVQRHAPGALTPHEARQKAEAELDRLRAELATAQAQLAAVLNIPDRNPNGHMDPEQYREAVGYDNALFAARNAIKTAAGGSDA